MGVAFTKKPIVLVALETSLCFLPRLKNAVLGLFYVDLATDALILLRDFVPSIELF